MNTPLKWHGGKSYLATKIIALMPPHTRYVEPCAGGLQVLIRKPCEGIAEFANDTNRHLMNFWEVLGRPSLFESFKRSVDAIPLSDREFEISKSLSECLGWHPNKMDGTMSSEAKVLRAVAFFVKMRQSRQGLGESYCTPTKRTRRGMNENVSAWLTAVDGLAEIHSRLRRVEIWNRPALEVIRELDSADTLFYLDPPYLHSTRSSKGEYGPHEMNELDHAELLSDLDGIEGKFMLSGYRSELYDRFDHWHRVEFDLPNNASSSKSKQRKTECVWMNFEPELEN